MEKRKGSGLRKEALKGFVVGGLQHHSFEFNRAVKEGVTAIIRLRRQLCIPRNCIKPFHVSEWWMVHDAHFQSLAAIASYKTLFRFGGLGSTSTI